MKKKVLIILGVIIVLIIAIIGYFVYDDLKQEDKLMAELNEINNLVNSENMDIDKINSKLNTIITKGDYATVEIAFKAYLRDIFDNMLKISEILEDEKLTNILTAENYIEDGKDFIKTKEYINTTRNELETGKQKYIEFFTEEKAMSYIIDKGLDSYYIDLYKKEFIGDIENSTNTTEVENSIDEIIELLNISEETINFLSDNKDSWKVENGNIYFNSDKLLNEYNEIISKL